MDQHLVNRYGNTKPTWNSTQTWTNWFLRQRLDTPIQSVKAMRDRLPRIPFFPIPLSVSRFDYTVSRIHDHSFPPVPDKEILCDWLIPSNPSKTLILYFHGGAYVLGDRTLFRFATGALSRDTKSSLLVSDYSKAPECPFPCALIDALSLYLHLLDENCPIKFDKIIFAGDSAGGGLSLSLLLYLKDHSMKLPDGVIGLSPWIDLTFSHPSLLLNRPFDYITSVIGDEKTDRDKDWLHNDRIYYYCTDNTQLNSPYVSPVYYSGSSSDFPPILIQFGEAELLRDEQLGFFTKVMPKANIRLEMYTDMIHVFQYIFRFSTQSITALERIAKFIESIERGDKIYRQALIVTGSQIKPFVDPFSIVVEGKKIVDEMRSEGILEWWDSYQKVHGLTTPKYLQDL